MVELFVVYFFYSDYLIVCAVEIKGEAEEFLVQLDSLFESNGIK